ncbi:acetate--CoA ligase family protein [Advenella kashmirensis]
MTTLLYQSDPSLAALLNPSSVAIIGASDNPDKIGGRPVYYMKKHGYTGKIYPINPARDIIQGEKSWGSVQDLPEVPELVIIAVAGQAAVDSVKACSELGVPAAIVITAGFSETGPQGRLLQDRMAALASAQGMRIVGPNSQGLANFGNGAIACFSTMFLEIEPGDGPVSVISQSGGMSAMIYGLLRNRGIGVRHVHATGNEADITVGQLAMASLHDPDIKLILMYLESLQNAEELAAVAAMAKRRGVALIAIKSGHTPSGAQAAASHTGALANQDSTINAFFEQHGILRARDPHELVRYAEFMLRSPLPAGNQTVIVSNSGASCVLAADAAEDNGLRVPPLTAATQDKLSMHLSSFATTRNPVDITAALLSNNRLFGQVLSCIGNDPKADSFVIDIPVAGRGYDVATFAEDTENFVSDSKKPVVVVAWQPAVAQAFRERNIPVFDDEEQAMSTLAAAHRFHASLTRKTADWSATPGQPVTPGKAGLILSEADSLDVLANAGIAVVDYIRCTDARQAVAYWQTCRQPVVIKACSEKIPHKSEHGLVALAIDSAAKIREVFDSQWASLEKLGIRDKHWVVAPMENGLFEFAAGMHMDPVFGPVIMAGTGGKYIEALNDVFVLIPPFSLGDVMDKLCTLQIAPLLQGVRGDPPADMQAFAELVVKLGKFAMTHSARIRSIDINPVLIREQGLGVIAVDALVEFA